MIINGIECISIKDAPDFLKNLIGWSPARTTLYKYIKKGKLPKPLSIKSGNQKFFNKIELEENAKKNLITFVE